MNIRELVVLSLLEKIEGDISNTDMQKYLFLLSIENRLHIYDFVPYKFGCFSFQAYHDKRKLEKLGLLTEDSKWSLSKNHNGYYPKLSSAMQKELNIFLSKYCNMRGEKLIKYVYTKYPYYAIKSEIIDNVLSTDEISVINAEKPKIDKTILFNIGYEGKSLECVINQLIREDVTLLCDVRKNPISRKYGFSKKTLSNALNSVGIEYKHFPEVGIESYDRKNLKSLSDYEKLFNKYRKTILESSQTSVKALTNLLVTKKRIALMCFEKDKQYCHRSVLAESIMSKIENSDIKEVSL